MDSVQPCAPAKIKIPQEGDMEARVMGACACPEDVKRQMTSFCVLHWKGPDPAAPG